MAEGDNAQVLQLLERLFVCQWRSLPLYLLESWPWSGPDNAAAQTALEGIGNHHTRHASQLAEAILARGGAVPPSGYPDSFTDANYHFVSLDYLIGELVQYQRDVVASIEADRNGSATDRELNALIDAILADEREDLSKLEKLAEQHGNSQAEGNEP